jgi:hypothetical protein
MSGRSHDHRHRVSWKIAGENRRCCIAKDEGRLGMTRYERDQMGDGNRRVYHLKEIIRELNARQNASQAEFEKALKRECELGHNPLAKRPAAQSPCLQAATQKSFQAGILASTGWCTDLPFAIKAFGAQR